MPSGEVTPGTTSNGIPASASASTSSPPRPKINGSPPLRRTTVKPAPRPLDHHAADLFLRIRVHGFLFPDVDAFAILAGEIQQVLVGQVIVEHGIRKRQQLAAFPGDEIRIARTGANQINLAHDAQTRRVRFRAVHRFQNLRAALGQQLVSPARVRWTRHRCTSALRRLANDLSPVRRHHDRA